jgi:hypothetical protein
MAALRSIVVNVLLQHCYAKTRNADRRIISILRDDSTGLKQQGHKKTLHCVHKANSRVKEANEFNVPSFAFPMNDSRPEKPRR